MVCFALQQAESVLQPVLLNPLGGLDNSQWALQGLLKDLT
jgi:hypothetical protein